MRDRHVVCRTSMIMLVLGLAMSVGCGDDEVGEEGATTETGDGDGDGSGDGDGDGSGDGDGDGDGSGDGDGDGSGDGDGDGDGSGDGDGDGSGDGDGDGDGTSCGEVFTLSPDIDATACTVPLNPFFTTTYVFVEVAGQAITMIAPGDCESEDGFFATGPGLESQPWCTALQHEGIVFCGTACADFLAESSAELETSCPIC